MSHPLDHRRGVVCDGSYFLCQCMALSALRSANECRCVHGSTDFFQTVDDEDHRMQLHHHHLHIHCPGIPCPWSLHLKDHFGGRQLQIPASLHLILTRSSAQPTELGRSTTACISGPNPKNVVQDLCMGNSQIPCMIASIILYLDTLLPSSTMGFLISIFCNCMSSH